MFEAWIIGWVLFQIWWHLSEGENDTGLGALLGVFGVIFLPLMAVIFVCCTAYDYAKERWT